MGEMVEFKSNGGTCTGYLAGTSGPGVIVIQEWWGLVPHITDIADRFAAEGFVALAPDMYHGEMTDEPDMAGKLLMSMNLATAGKDLSGAVDLLQERTGRTKVGVTGFCMGGGLALMAACLRPDAIAAAARGPCAGCGVFSSGAVSLITLLLIKFSTFFMKKPADT